MRLKCHLIVSLAAKWVFSIFVFQFSVFGFVLSGFLVFLAVEVDFILPAAFTAPLFNCALNAN